MKKVKEILVFMFGKQTKKRYMRILILLSILLLAVMLIQNISCGYDNGFYFKWQPAAKIEVKK